jgi:hypothetical protein
VSPILGIWASQNYSRYSLPTSFDSIATSTVETGGASFIEFTSIPSTYTHLQLRYMSKSTTDGTLISVKLEVNSDTGSNYAYHGLYGDGGSAGAFGAANASYIVGPETVGGGAARANMFRATVLDILDYANTNKFKTFRYLDGSSLNTNVAGTQGIRLVSGLWRSTNAITSLKITPLSGNFAQYSHFALYGIKGA